MEQKNWYKVSSKGGGWPKFETIEQLVKYKTKTPYFPILKITKVTEEQLDEDIVKEINSKINYK